MKTKKCSHCKEEKPATREFFYTSKATKSGFQSWCIACMTTPEQKEKRQNAIRRWQKSNPEKLRRYNREWARNNKEKANTTIYRWMKENKDSNLAIQYKYQNAIPPSVYCVKYKDKIIYVGKSLSPKRRENTPDADFPSTVFCSPTADQSMK